MENLITAFIAVLKHKEVLAEKEAQKLDEELRTATLPSNLKEAIQLIDNIFKK